MVSTPPPVRTVPAGQEAVTVAKPVPVGGGDVEPAPFGPWTVVSATCEAVGPPVAHSAQAVVALGPAPRPDSVSVVQEEAAVPETVTGLPEASDGKVPSRWTETSVGEG